jgi:hypothetical protein
MEGSETSDINVMVMMTDENNKPLQLFNSTVRPRETIIIPFRALGSATVQLFINNALVREETYVP